MLPFEKFLNGLENYEKKTNLDSISNSYLIVNYKQQKNSHEVRV